MNFKPRFTVLVVCLLMQLAMSRDPGFGNVGVQDLQDELPAAYASAPAVVLYRSVVKRFFHQPPGGFRVETLVYKRIRINTREGFDYATVSRDLFKTKTHRRTMDNVKGATYNLEDGKLVETRLKSSDTYRKTLSSSMDQEIFTLPAVKEGSIIEYQYRVDSPFGYSLEDITLQYNIPILKQDISISIPEYFNYNQWIKGYLPVQPLYSTTTESIDVLNRSGGNQRQAGRNGPNNNTFNYKVTTTNYSMEDIPALMLEHNIDNLNNYRATIVFELHWVDFPHRERELFADSWESVVRKIYDNHQFGKKLEEGHRFRDTINIWIAGITSEQEKAHRILRKLQHHMNWNGNYSIHAEQSLQDAFHERTGNTAEINLMLVAMLREAGSRAHPVLISTISNGIPLFPTINGFNHVVAAIEINGSNVLLDASNQFSSPDILPLQSLNWYGMLVEEDGAFKKIPLQPDTMSTALYMMQMSIDQAGVLTGKVRSSYDRHRGLHIRIHDAHSSGSGDVEELETSRKIKMTTYELANLTNPDVPVQEAYEFSSDAHVEKVGNRLIFNPMFFNAMKEIPFQEETRRLPVFFGFPWQTRNMITIDLPEGYKIQTIPENLRFSTEGNLGNFTYKIEVTQLGQLQLLTEFQINQGLIAAGDYPILKEFYKNVAKKVAEPVVLKKIEGNEHQEVTTGGR